MKRIRIYFLLFCAMGSLSNSQSSISIEVKDGKAHRETTSYLNGYNHAVEGSSIPYHSAHPDAEEALLVRTNTESPTISWQTDTIPTSSTGKPFQFVWLAGIEKIGWGNATTPHRFRLSVNGVDMLTFTNKKDSTASHWRIDNGHGTVLRFESEMTDKYGDLFGYMYLSVPNQLCSPGSPLTIRIDGENAGSPEWVMVFKHPFNFVPQLRVEPALARNQAAGSRLLRMSLDNLIQGRTVQVRVDGRKTVTDSLRVGANIFLLPFKATSASPKADVTYSHNRVVSNRYTLPVPPVRMRSVYLLPHTHNDIGYTDVQPEVERKQWRYLEQAMDMIRQTRNYPPDARYKWNLEILWPLETWLQHASSEKKEEFLADVREGSIGLNALLVNPLTGLANAPEMSHYTDFARSLTTSYGFPMTTAVVDDIPGFTWGFVSALAQSGVKYFASGPNSGDRIGYIIDEWGDKPFYWTSQSGTEKILCWVAGSSYASFHQATLAKAGPERLMKLMRKLDETNYPYDMYFIPYTLGDNYGNDTTLADFVKKWNEQYASPRLVIATHKQLFADFEKLYGSSLPTFSGDLTPYWEDGAASTAYETALARHSVDKLLQAETIWSLQSPEHFPDSLANAAWRQVTLWDEHTWGADISVSDPDSSKSTAQWKIKRQYALDADSMAARLLTLALPSEKPGSSSFDIWNTSSWTRSDIIRLSPEQSQAGDRVIDEHGKSLASQRLASGELAVLAANIPPMSALQIRVQRGKSEAPRGEVSAKGLELRTDEFVLTLNEVSGSIKSFRSLETGREFVDGTHGNGLNEYLYVPGTNSDSTSHLRNVRITVVDNGPLVATLKATGDAPGCNSYSSTYTIRAGSNRVNIVDSFDKKSIRSKEGVHIAFPFALANGQLRYDVAAGIVRPESDQLRGACKNFFSVVSWADVSNDSMGIAWATPDVPEIEIGAINAERPWMKSIAPSSTLFSYVMNNYWHTNYKADQEGPAVFRYSILPHGVYSPGAASRFGTESRQPLLVAPAAKPAVHAAPPFLLSNASVMISSARPAKGEQCWLVLLYNPEETAQQVSFRSVNGKQIPFFRSNADGSHVGSEQSSLELVRNATTYVLLKGKN